MKCEYGCDQEAKYITSNGRQCCAKHSAGCIAIKAKNSAGVSQAHKDGKIPGFNDQHRINSNLAAIEAGIAKCFVEDSEYTNETIKGWLFKEFGYLHQCSQCGLDEWNELPIPLELDHANGNNRDARLHNLWLLCPNCHAQTPTWRGRNMNNGQQKVTDKDLITALDECKNIRQALLKVGLAAKGANYDRANRLMRE